LLNEFSDEWNILFQKCINRLSNKNETRNENSIKHANFDKFTNVDDVLTRWLIQNLDYFRCIWMSSLNVTNKIDYSQLFAAELRFFFENNAISSFNVCQNIVQSLNMLHNITSNFRKNKFIVLRRFWFFYLYVVYERQRVIKNMINDNFIDHSNELNHKIDCFMRIVVIFIKSSEIMKTIMSLHFSINDNWSYSKNKFIRETMTQSANSSENSFIAENRLTSRIIIRFISRTTLIRRYFSFSFFFTRNQEFR
jgi:hypothetical protein